MNIVSRLKLLFLLVLAVPYCAFAASLPSGTITIVVPFPPGGSNDIIARTFANELNQLTGNTVIVENKAGAGGNVGALDVARAKPDGSKLLLTAPGPLAINQFLHKDQHLDPTRDFAPVGLIASVPIVLMTNPKLPVDSVKSLVAYAKANPGKLSFGSSGIGSTNHLAGELLNFREGLDMVHVPYKGAAPAMNDLVAGNIQVLFDNMPAARVQVEANTVRALAVTTKERSPVLPDLPTMAEAGTPDFVASAWFGLVAPAGTPSDVLDGLAQATRTVLANEAVIDKLQRLGAVPGNVTGPDFRAFLGGEADKWGQVIEKADIKVQ